MSEITILNKITCNQQFIYDYQPFRHFLEENIPWVLENKIRSKPVDLHRAHQFEYDLAGYLLSEGIPYEYHWFVMRLNGMKYNWDFDEKIDILVYPDNTVFDDLIGQFSAMQSM